MKRRSRYYFDYKEELASDIYLMMSYRDYCKHREDHRKKIPIRGVPLVYAMVTVKNEGHDAVRIPMGEPVIMDKSGGLSIAGLPATFTAKR